MLRLHEYRYHRPRVLSEALLILQLKDALPISGGTDLMPNMKHRLFTPNHLVGLKGLAELSGIYLVDEEGQRMEGEDGAVALSIGATETLTDVSRHPLVRKLYPSLAKAAGQVAGPQIRNQGTIGGNLCLETRCTFYNQTEFWRKSLGYCLKKDGDVCHVTKVGKKCVAAHSADTPPVLITLGAVVVLASADGEREVPIADFFVSDGAWNTVRQHEEIVKRIRIPLPPPGLRTVYRKVRQRNSIDFPILSIALAAEMEGKGIVRDLSLVVSALGSRPRVVTGLIERIEGKKLEDFIEDIAEISFKQCHPLENIIVDPEWRRAMVPVYVTRALEEVAGSD